MIYCSKERGERQMRPVDASFKQQSTEINHEKLTLLSTPVSRSWENYSAEHKRSASSSTYLFLPITIKVRQSQGMNIISSNLKIKPKIITMPSFLLNPNVSYVKKRITQTTNGCYLNHKYPFLMYRINK